MNGYCRREADRQHYVRGLTKAGLSKMLRDVVLWSCAVESRIGVCHPHLATFGGHCFPAGLGGGAGAAIRGGGGGAAIRGGGGGGAAIRGGAACSTLGVTGNFGSG